jgi:hypothetical protein
MNIDQQAQQIANDLVNSVLIDDKEYEDRNGPNYVYPNQRLAAETIVNEWKKPDGHRMILLKAQMQAGKTGVIRHICYLLNKKGMDKVLKIEEDNVHVMSNITDNALVQQTLERMKGVMWSPQYNVFHPKTISKSKSKKPSKKSSSEYKKELHQKQLRQNRVLIMDESHYATEDSGQVATLLTEINSPLSYDIQKMRDNNVYLLLVSATPFAELGINTADKFIVSLEPAPTYYGVRNMIADGNIIDYYTDMGALFRIHAKKVKNAPEKTDADIGGAFDMLLRNPQFLVQPTKPGFIIIRESLSDAGKVWIAQLKSYMDKLPKDEHGLAKYTYFDYNAETKKDSNDDVSISNILELYRNCVSPKTFKLCYINANAKKLVGIDAIMGFRPDRYVIIFIKRMFLAGKTLDTNFLKLTVDLPLKNPNDGSVDTLVQGLVGRCCGVNKDNNVRMITDKKRVDAYINYLDGLPMDHKPALRARNLDTSPEKVALPISGYSKIKPTKQQYLDYKKDEAAEAGDDVDDVDEITEGLKKLGVKKEVKKVNNVIDFEEEDD